MILMAALAGFTLAQLPACGAGGGEEEIDETIEAPDVRCNTPEDRAEGCERIR